MYPQHVAGLSSSYLGFAALQSQDRAAVWGEYPLAAKSAMIPVGGVCAARFSFMRQWREKSLAQQETENWRNRCQRASKPYWRCAPSSLLRPAHSRKTNTLWSRLSRSAKSQFTLVNTNRGQPLEQAVRAVSSGLTCRAAGTGDTPC